MLLQWCFCSGCWLQTQCAEKSKGHTGGELILAINQEIY